MIKSLYKIFQHWSKNGSVYLYSDPHFGDWESYTFRGLTTNKTKEELDQFQVNNINKVVHKSDTIIFLGDIGDPTLLKKIKGYKVLITGNHDKGSSIYEDYFDEIYTGCLFNIHGHDHSGADFKTYVLKDYDADMSCNEMLKNYLTCIKNYKLNKLNLCAEWINYTPVSLSDIIKSGILTNISTIHRNYLDKIN